MAKVRGVGLQEKKYSVYKTVILLVLAITFLVVVQVLFYLEILDVFIEIDLLIFIIVATSILLAFLSKKSGKYLLKQNNGDLQLYTLIGVNEKIDERIPSGMVSSVDLVEISTNKSYSIRLTLNNGKKIFLDQFSSKDKAEAKHAEIQKLLDSK